MSADREIAERVTTLLASAKRDVLVAAPYMQRWVVERLFKAIPAEVTEVKLVTRWLPEDVAAGVSDLAVLDAVQLRAGAQLFLQTRLHAKLFRADDSRLVGSVNVTGRALGWAPGANVELLVSPVASESTALHEFESRLLATSVAATPDIQESIQNAAEALKLRTLAIRSEAAARESWIPLCASPDKLWSLYSNDPEAWQVIASAQRAGHSDLAVLGLPSGLPKVLFEQFVGAAFAASEVAAALDRLAERGFETQEGVRLLQTLRPEWSAEEARTRLEVALRWMEYFGEADYQRVPVGEVFRKGRRLV